MAMSNVSLLKSIRKSVRALKKDIEIHLETTPNTIKDMHNDKAATEMICLKNHLHKAMKGLHSSSRSTMHRMRRSSKSSSASDKTYKKISSQDGPISKRKKSAKRQGQGIASGIHKDLDEPISKRRKTVKGQEIESKVPKKSAYEPFIFTDKRVIKALERAIATNRPRDLFEIEWGINIPKDLVLKREGLAYDIPEYLYWLVRRAVAVRMHYENMNDRFSKMRLDIVESKIPATARYYKMTNQLRQDWKFDPASARALVA